MPRLLIGSALLLIMMNLSGFNVFGNLSLCNLFKKLWWCFGQCGF